MTISTSFAGVSGVKIEIDADNLKSSFLDTDLSSVSSSDDTIASAKAIKSYIDSTEANTFVSSAGFNSSTGVLTLTKNDSSTVTVDLDGKYQDSLTFGISNTNIPIFTSGVVDNDFLRVDGTSIEGRSAAEVLSDIGGQASLTFGISNTNIPIFTSGVVDNDFLRVDGTSIEGRSAAEVLSDIGGQASLTFGISDTNAVKIDSSTVSDNEYARFTENGLESRSTAEVLSDIGAQSSLTFGIGDTNIPIFESGVEDDDFLRVNGTSIEGISRPELISILGLALSAFEDTTVASNITAGTLPVARYNNPLTSFTQENGEHIETDMVKARDVSGLFLLDDSNTKGVVVRDGGNVGIKAAFPLFPLHVKGNGGQNSVQAALFAYHHAGSSWGHHSGTSWTTMNNTIGARIHKGLVVEAVYLMSDERIKKDIIDINDMSALETLRLIKPKKYKYKNQKSVDQFVFGFIAQEVNEILPNAISIQTDYIPTHQESAVITAINNENKTSILNFQNNHDLKVNEKLQCFDADDEEVEDVLILEIVNEKSIKVDTDFFDFNTTFEDESGFTQENIIFVYGKEVDDFYNLNKDAIWTVATAALQEVDRQLQTAKNEIEILKERLTALEAA